MQEAEELAHLNDKLKTVCMSTHMDRRSLLKKGLLMAGGLTVAPGMFSSALKRPLNICQQPGYVYEPALFADGPVPLKARLFANENPFGPSAKAKQAIVDAMAESFRYPFEFARDLQEKITTAEGLKQENIILGAGSSEIIMAAALLFTQKPNANIITADPTYEDLPSKFSDMKGQWKKIPLTADYKLDLDAMEKAIDANTTLIYVCNPNNPTATVLEPGKLRSFCERVSQKVTVFVDEAYIDYLDDPKANSMMDLVRTGKNIIVARTFSKLHGFAGLRVGYAMAQPDMIRKLNDYTNAFATISATSLHAAYASYGDDAFLKEALQKTMQSKEYLYSVLKKEGYEYIPSSTNFVMFPVKMDSRQFVQELGKRGVGVRFWQFNKKEWCRISIGRMDEMEAFAAAFKEIS